MIVKESDKTLFISRFIWLGATTKRLLAYGLLSAAFIGCASNPKGGDTPDTDGAPLAEAAKTESVSSRSEDRADALMAKLAAPLEEPAPKPVAKPVPQSKVSARPAKTSVKPVAKSQPEVSATKPVAKAAPEPVAEPALAHQVVAVAEDESPAPVVSRPESKPSPKGMGKPLNVSKKDLPVNYGIWKIRKGEATLDKDIVITTPTWEMGKEGYMSQVWVTVMDDKILVSSSSDIDSTTPGIGLSFDKGNLIPFSKVEGNNIAVLEGQWLDTLVNSSKMDIYLGFFPDRRPKSDTFKSDLDLEGIGRVVPTYLKMIN